MHQMNKSIQFKQPGSELFVTHNGCHKCSV